MVRNYSSEISLTQSEGHSLVELLVVLAIFSCIASTLAPNTLNSWVGKSLPLHARIVSSAFVHAGIQAKVLNSAVALEFSKQMGEIALLTDLKQPGAPARRRIHKLPTSIEITDLSFGASGSNSETFLRHPSGVASPGRVVLRSADGRSCIITIGLRGANRLRCF